MYLPTFNFKPNPIIMKINKVLLAFIAIAFLSSSLISQSLIQYPVGSVKLKIEQYEGTNGASVVYNPEKQLYYTVFAGNATYPLETFDKNGNNLFQKVAGADMRGMWWNPKTHGLEGNCYADGGIVSIGINEYGLAEGYEGTILYGSYNQPSENAAGVFDPKAKEILYFDGGIIWGHSRKNGKLTKTLIVPFLPVDIANINWSSMVFTGVPTMEYGLLDYVEKKIYLFDKKSWDNTGTVTLPVGTKVYDKFNFSYANGFVFLFDQDEREWTGYRIF